MSLLNLAVTLGLPVLRFLFARAGVSEEVSAKYIANIRALQNNGWQPTAARDAEAAARAELEAMEAPRSGAV